MGESNEEENEEGKPEQSRGVGGGRGEGPGQGGNRDGVGGGGAVEFRLSAVEFTMCRYCIERLVEEDPVDAGALTAAPFWP